MDKLQRVGTDRVSDARLSSILLPRPKGSIKVGRSPEQDFRIDDAHISRSHAHFEFLMGKWHVLDNGSLNFTFLNGRQLQPFQLVPLSYGDLVRFGPPNSPPAHHEYQYQLVEISPGPISGMIKFVDSRAD